MTNSKRNGQPVAVLAESKGMTEAQVAAMLNISPRTLQAWRLQGRGPEYMKLGRAVRYDRRVVDAWMAERTRASTSDPGVQQRGKYHVG
jgi:predicted DNA-binding transcriptional regulator AlpA